MTGKSIGAPAQTQFIPAKDQSTVKHLRLTIKHVSKASPSVVHLYVQCGMVGFPIAIHAPTIPDIFVDTEWIAEYPASGNPLDTEFTAIYPADQKPSPKEEKPMTNIIVAAANGDALIPVNQGQIGDATVQTVNARELHAYLEVATRFNDWITARINDFGFVEEQDFTSFTENSVKGGRPSKEYAITLDMAKELSMVERNDKGKEARRYFIECERKLKTATLTLPQTLPEALRLAADLAEENQNLIAENQQKTESLAVAEPKAQALDRISAGKGTLTITQASKVLGIKRSDLTDWLSENGWIYRQNGSWVAYQRHIQNGRLRYKEANYTDEQTEMPVTKPYCHITRKGMALIAQAFETPIQLETIITQECGHDASFI